MMKNLLLAAMMLCCSDCKAQEPHFSLVITLDPGESVMVKTADGEHSTFIDYNHPSPRVQHKGISVDDAYHLEYHLIIWAQCPGCTMFYNAAEGGCRNPYCPSKHS